MGTVPIQYPGCLKESRIINFYEVRSKKKKDRHHFTKNIIRYIFERLLIIKKRCNNK